MRKVVYLDSSLNYQTVTEGVSVDYQMNEDKVVNVGLLFEKDGDTFLAYIDDGKESVMQRYFAKTVKVQIQTKGGNWRLDNFFEYVLSDSRYIQGSIYSPRFGFMETDPSGTGVITEVQFFIDNIGKSKNGIPFPEFMAYANLLNRLFPV